jgi:PAS domain S-box-containing protein
MSEVFGGDKRAALKELIKVLHEGADPREVKGRFAQVVRDTTPAEIAMIEQELIEEGMPRKEIQRLCDVHLDLFRESLEKETTLAPAGHPIHVLMEEHAILLGFANDLRNLAHELRDREDSISEHMERLNHVVQHFRDSESHYLREENVLFPFLEKHGIKEPPAIMWMEHDRIRGIEKDLYGLIDRHQEVALGDFVRQLGEVARSLADMLSSHFGKESNILFPTALKVISDNEWQDIGHQFDELGYCPFTPETPRMSLTEAEAAVSPHGIEGVIPFATGGLSREQIQALLDTLPVDITFVDRDDTVRYFNQSQERIFPRTRAVIGRKVQQCHPQKSVHVVSQILEDFKSGARDVAEFWINLGGRLVSIRYWPVRNGKGDYLGCLEVTQDITDIKKIEGEKRLL